MDLASIIGLVLCFILIIFGIVTGSEGVKALGSFLHLQSAIITFGGSFAAVLTMTSSLKSYVSNLKSFSLALKVVSANEVDTIKQIIKLSNVARKEGLLALEEAAADIEDEFLKKGILLIVDGTDPELVRSIMETELNCVEGRHKGTISFWENLASMGPAWGMIGTLIGLINMLKNLSDPNSIGPSMSVALITTLYGSMLANWICTPIATKLKGNDAKELMIKEVMVEGLLSIQAGENPRVIEEKLKSFLSPNIRATLTEGGDEVG